MAGKRNCKDCGGTREPEATAYSYCIGCNNRRQRERYRAQRASAGLEVTPRRLHNSTNINNPHGTNADEARRARIIAGDRKPGPCDCCGEHEPRSLTVIRIGDPTNELHLYGDGERFALWCSPCRNLSKTLTDATLHRATLLAEHLKRNTNPTTNTPLTLYDILPDVNDVVMGTYKQQQQPADQAAQIAPQPTT